MSDDTVDLVAALQRAQEQPGADGYMSMRELRRATGNTDRVLLRRLHALQEAGRLEVRTVSRINICGALQRVPGYRLLAGE